MSDSVPPLDSSDAAPPDASEANDQGNLYYDQKKYEEAVAAYSKAIELHPRYSWAYCNRAAVHLALGKTAEAVTDYSMALEIDPADSALYNGRGFALTQTDPPDLQAALINVDQAIQLEETNGAAHCTRGYIGKKLAEQHTPHSPEWERLVDDAIVHETRACELEPAADEPRQYLHQLQAMKGDGLPSAVDPTKGSWLHKKGGLKDGERNWMKGGRRNWKVRWFVLHTEKISWMESPGGKELGSLAVDTFDRVDMDPDNRNLFCLRSKTRDLWLKADDEGTTGAWVSALRANLK